mmetsp:Transcript_35648/g.72654  ORF Transcript_35648/g.72654 Transcript_35648/m.72654 type:complete len:164 (-) Transcript_35648:139-630(-)
MAFKRSTSLLSSLSTESFLGASNTINTYMIALDQGSRDRFAQLFMDRSGSCEVVKMGKVFSGRSELRELCSLLHERFLGAMHFEANPTLRLLPDGRVANESYWYAVMDGKMTSMGIHTDILVVEPETKQWVFQSRKIVHTWTKDGGRERTDGGCWSGVVPQWQ